MDTNHSDKVHSEGNQKFLDIDTHRLATRSTSRLFQHYIVSVIVTPHAVAITKDLNQTFLFLFSEILNISKIKIKAPYSLELTSLSSRSKKKDSKNTSNRDLDIRSF